MLPILKNHDQTIVEVWCISCGPHHDWISEHLKKRCDHWLDFRFHNDAQAARLIADLRLDVLVELGGLPVPPVHLSAGLQLIVPLVHHCETGNLTSDHNVS